MPKSDFHCQPSSASELPLPEASARFDRRDADGVLRVPEARAPGVGERGQHQWRREHGRVTVRKRVSRQPVAAEDGPEGEQFNAKRGYGRHRRDDL